jgi:hypothetical protein
LSVLQCDREASFGYSYLRNLRFGAICFFGSQGRSRTRTGFADRTEVVGGDHFSLKIKPNGKEMTEFDGILAELQCDREASFPYSYLTNVRFRVGRAIFC